MTLFPTISGCGKNEITTDAGRESERFAKMRLKELALGKLHHGPDQFINPFTDMSYNGRLPSVLKWKLTPSKYKHLFSKERVKPVNIDWQKIQSDTGLSITYLNHSGLYIQDQGVRILVDPLFFGLSFFIKNFSPLSFSPFPLPPVDHILITHGHYDHLDKKTLNRFPKTTNILTPLGYQDIFNALDMTEHKELDWYDSFEKDGLKLTLLPCHHWSMRNPLIGANRSLWGSYLIQTRSGPTIYISGDTAYFDKLKEIGDEFDIDLAILNVGAYEPRWMMKNSHLSPKEAVEAFNDLNARHLIIVHWGTFRLGDEPIFLPPLQLKKQLAKHAMEDALIPIEHGQTIIYNGKPIIS